MTTRFFTQDATESFSPSELIEVINDIGSTGKVIRALEWDTESDFYGVAITTDMDLTAEQVADLYLEWESSDYDDEILG